MTEKESALYSHYIIDGVRQDTTPADLMNECLEFPDPEIKGNFADIIDESTDPPVTSFTYDNTLNGHYAKQTTAASVNERAFRMLYPMHFTRLQITKALLSRLWSKGHFRLGDLRIWAQWDWNTRPIGNMAAFYSSVETASDWLYGIGVKVNDYMFIESDGESNVKFYAWLPEYEENSVSEMEVVEPYESRHPWISEERKCPRELIKDESSKIIYIPFDTCSFKLGGSLLAEVHGHNGGPAPQMMDPDYFIDCYEVIRELVEDGIILSGVTTADGGLATAASKICKGTGMEIDISGLIASYQPTDSTKVLFSEVPGVLVQISEENYDYFDSQLLLQDVAYYPIGRITSDKPGIRFIEGADREVAGILASLLAQASEGED
jgi:hypothetical protein